MFSGIASHLQTAGDSDRTVTAVVKAPSFQLCNAKCDALPRGARSLAVIPLPIRPNTLWAANNMGWLRNSWAAFGDSYDADEAVAGSSPVPILVSALGLGGALAAIGYLPWLSRASTFELPWVSLLLGALAAVTTLTAWLHRCRGPIGTACSLTDNMLWSSALLWAVGHTQGGFSIGLALAYAAMILGYTTRFYSLSFLFGLTTSIPPVLTVLLFEHEPAVALLLLAIPVVGLANSAQTLNRRAMLERQRRLETALGAADRLADESMQAALAATLLDLGHFLHELKNNQTSVLANLSFLEESCELPDEAREAVADARQAQLAEHTLVVRTMDGLKARAQPVNTSFLLGDILDAALKESAPLQATADGPRVGFVMSGNPDHLKTVLRNLVRNASQAGAKRIAFSVSLGPSGASVDLLVHDDGQGIPEALRSGLFRSFVESNKVGGTGLGLYLCRRYVEILGGSITLEDGPLGGAAFRIRLPGRIVRENGWSVRRISLPVFSSRR
jgi:signal transduction histidine kinase